MPINDNTDVKLDAIKERCKTDLKFLVTKIMGLTRWGQLHDELVQFVDSPGDRKLVLLPRGHQKSTIISVGWVVQQVLRDPNIRILIVSAQWKLAKDLLHQIKSVLTQSALKDIFGPFETNQTRFTTEFIDVAQKTKHSKDPTISTGGIDSGKTGSHCDLLIFDDCVSPENTTSAEMIKKTIDSYRDCLPLLDPGGKIVVIGTRYSMADMYGYILENESRSINGYFFQDESERKSWRNVQYRKKGE